MLPLGTRQFAPLRCNSTIQQTKVPYWVSRLLDLEERALPQEEINATAPKFLNLAEAGT